MNATPFRAAGPLGRGPAILVLAAVALAAAPAEARVDVTVDADTLNMFLAQAGPSELRARTPLGPVGMIVSDMRVTGFDPAAGNPGAGWILASFRLRVPQVGVDTIVEPRLSLEVADRGGSKQCVLKFHQAAVELQGLGRLDLAALLPQVQLTPGIAWAIDTAAGPKEVRPRLVDARVGVKNIRLSFDVDIGVPSEAGKGGPVPSK